MIDTPLIENRILLKAIKKRNKKLTKLSCYLSQLESHLALIFATSPDIMMLLSSNGKIVKVNNAIKNIFGLSCSKQIEGKYLWQTQCFDSKKELIKSKIQELLASKYNSKFYINDVITTCKTKADTQIELEWKFMIGDKEKKYIVAIASQLTR